MKRLLLIAGLLITLCHIGTAAVYAACRCYNWYGDLVCEGNFCWADSLGNCHCTDKEIEE